MPLARHHSLSPSAATIEKGYCSMERHLNATKGKTAKINGKSY
jgi:hypothetical protein